MFGHGFHPLKARQARSIPNLQQRPRGVDSASPRIAATKSGQPLLTPERQAAIDHAIEVMAQGLPWGAALRAFTRDEMHER
jgi:hypothetical protein